MLLSAVVDAALEQAGYPAMDSTPARRKMSAVSWPEIVCRIGAKLALALEFAHRKGVFASRCETCQRAPHRRWDAETR